MKKTQERRASVVLEHLDRNINLKILFWSFPAVFLVHDPEEILTAERFWRENRDALPLPAFIKERLEITTRQMTAAVSCILPIVISASYLAAKPPIRAGRRVEVFDAAVAVLFLNTLQHASQTLVIGRYAPGVVSALGVSLPYSVYVFHRLGKERLIAEGGLRRSLKSGGLLAVPVVLGAHAAGRLLAR